MEASEHASASSSVSPENGTDQSSHQPPPSHTRPSNKLWLILVVALVVLGGLVFALWSSNSTTQPAKQAVVPTTPPVSPDVSEKLIVGTDATLSPMEYLDNGKLVGYDIDLAAALANELGTQVEFKNIIFDDLFTALDTKEINMIISAVTITPEREQKYTFSTPYLNAGQVIITKKDNTTIKSAADLKGKRIAVQKGTTNEASAVKYTSDNLVLRYPDFVQATQALVDGKVDAIFNDLPGAKGTIIANPTLKIASDPFTNEYYGIVFRKGDPAATQINQALKSLDGKGVLAELKQKWLN